ncbi:hypothetical protein K3725_00900 [Leisingera sp. S132]|uniref:hypothetical protein n=1 Tax=Leisingera sp. S132 TaxID=2867016 RepID=UPI0021A8853F|nr:hypothetical protein [Leisingera sp. S132]UWQ79599.1 hypothetical protein K3725_00900 [Leisingera sp. S132]
MTAAVLLLPQIVIASEGRISGLAASPLLQRMAEKGEWEARVSSEAIHYTCLTCVGRVKARLEVLAPYGTGSHASVWQRYLAERKQFCADLAASREGRCVSTEAKKLRGGALTGFRSVHETDAYRVISIGLFYHEYGSGPELIHTTIQMDRGVELEHDPSSMFLHHMARPTIWY